MRSTPFAALAALSVPFAIVAACATYGEDASQDGGTSGTSSGKTSSSSGASGGGGDDDSGQTSGAPPPPSPDANLGPPCPVCPDGESCVGAGCTPGERTTASTCQTGVPITGEDARTVFVCPDANTTNLPPTGSCDSTFLHPAANFLLGSGNAWQITVLGQSFFYHPGTCGGATACGSGGGNVPSALLPPDPNTFAPGETLTIGSNVPITNCVTFRVTFHEA